MSCDRCGADTTRPRLCRECALLESVEHETGTHAPPLYECSECGDERAESPDSVCWLCRSDRHERGDDGTPELRTDGGQPVESGRGVPRFVLGGLLIDAVGLTAVFGVVIFG